MAKQLPPEGLYMANIAKVYVGRNKQGNLSVNLGIVVFQKVNEADPRESQDVPGLTRTIYMVISEKTADFQAKNLEACGYDYETHGAIEQIDSRYTDNGTSPLTGKEIPVYCKHEENNKGEMEDRWQVSRGVAAPEMASENLLQRANALLMPHLTKKGDKQAEPVRKPAPGDEPKADQPTEPNEEAPLKELPW